MPTKNLSLSASTKQMLDKLDNASRYVEDSVNTHWSRAINALNTLRGSDWTSNEILAACDVLNGCWMTVQDTQWHAHSMSDGPEYAAKWDVSPERWAEICKMVKNNGEIAHALDIVVVEFWCQNTELDKMIRAQAR